MRPFEITLGIALAVAAMSAIAPPSRKSRQIPLAIGLGAAIAHLFAEGPRLQAAPLYAALLPAIVLAFAAPPFLVSMLVSALSLLAVAGGLLLCGAYPVFALPKPAGAHPIGTKTMYLTDGPRKFVAEVWYPAASCAKKLPTVYREPAALTWRSAHHRYVRTNSCIEAQPAQSAAGWPIVLFSPSSGGYRSQNSIVLEELASHGYVAVGVDHPYSSSRVALDDGTVIHSLPSDWLRIETQAAWKRSIPIVEATLQRRVLDMRFAYESLRSMPLGRIVDFSRAAAVGHSFGGAAAAELCRTDARFRAGINFDGWMFSGVNGHGVAKPFLFVIADDPLWKSNDGPYPDSYDGNARLGTKQYHGTVRRGLRYPGSAALRIIGAGHANYADLALFRGWPISNGGDAARATLELTREFALAFLDGQLKGKPSPLLQKKTNTEQYELVMEP